MRYLEDFEPGQKFGSDAAVVDSTAIKGFAAEFDPQPFHLDEESAKSSFFGELVASGWHTAAITMRLLVTSDLAPFGGVIGASVEQLRWTMPVRPGDALRLRSEVVEVRFAEAQSMKGTIKLRTETYNQRNEIVQVLVANLIVHRRRN